MLAVGCRAWRRLAEPGHLPTAGPTQRVEKKGLAPDGDSGNTQLRTLVSFPCSRRPMLRRQLRIGPGPEGPQPQFCRSRRRLVFYLHPGFGLPCGMLRCATETLWRQDMS